MNEDAHTHEWRQQQARDCRRCVLTGIGLMLAFWPSMIALITWDLARPLGLSREMAVLLVFGVFLDGLCLLLIALGTAFLHDMEEGEALPFRTSAS